MMELRSAPRINVSWRGALRMPGGRLLLVRVVNVSREGLMIECGENLSQQKTYPVLLEIPAINGSREIYKVQCSARVRHSILSVDSYKIGLQLTDISGLHAELVQAWVSLANRT